jgi:hypothetical protein
MTTHCPHCGEQVDADDLIEERPMPEGCQCEPSDWRPEASINPICDVYQPEDDNEPDGNCLHCEHPKNCHDNKPKG